MEEETQRLAEELVARNVALLQELGLSHKLCDHSDCPVTTYEQAAEIRKRFDLTGVESKSLFLKVGNRKRVKGEGGGVATTSTTTQYFMLITLEGRKADLKKIKQALGTSKLSIPPPEDLLRETGCTPGCAVPWGFKQEIGIVVDSCVYNPATESREGEQKFIYSPGKATITIEIAQKDIGRILSHLHNEIIFLNE